LGADLLATIDETYNVMLWKPEQMEKEKQVFIPIIGPE
jgi:hypothetical protein